MKVSSAHAGIAVFAGAGGVWYKIKVYGLAGAIGSFGVFKTG